MSRINCSSLAIAVVALMLASSRAHADDPIVIQFDPATKSFSSRLPHRTPFTLDVPAPKQARGVAVDFWEVGESATTCAAATKKMRLSGKPQVMTADATERRFQVTLPALHAGSAYCISVEIVVPWTTAQNDAVVGAVVGGVAKLATQGSISRVGLLSAVTTSLGSDATSLVEGTSRTVAQAIDEHLWRTDKSPALKALEKTGVDYRDQLADLIDYRAKLADFANDVAGGGGAFGESILAVLALLDHNELVTRKTDPKPTALPKVEEIKKAIALTLQKAKAIPANCNSITDAKDKKDCFAFRDHLTGRSSPFPSAGGIIDDIEVSVSDFAAAEQALAAELKLLVRDLVIPSAPITATAAAPSYTAAAPLYISGDVGIVMPIFTNTSHSYGTDAVLYVAASVALAPIDKDVPLREQGGFRRRFSIVGGFTLGQVKNSDDTVTGVFGGKGVMGGFGLRLTDYVRFGAGAMIVRQDDTNKLVTDTHVRVTPYLSLSIDLDVAGIFIGIFTKGAGLRI